MIVRGLGFVNWDQKRWVIVTVLAEGIPSPVIPPMSIFYSAFAASPEVLQFLILQPSKCLSEASVSPVLLL